jgi:putative redox protein
MRIRVVKHGEPFHFEAFNEDGLSVHMDASPEIGGENKGVRPMQMIIMGLGGCSGIDVCNILKKQKQVFSDFTININAKRRDNPEPKIFEHIVIEFVFEGEKLDKLKAKRAVDLSIEKYCSVSEILRQSATLEYKVIVNKEIIA